MAAHILGPRPLSGETEGAYATTIVPSLVILVFGVPGRLLSSVALLESYGLHLPAISPGSGICSTSCHQQECLGPWWVQIQVRKVKVKHLKAKKQGQAPLACQGMLVTSHWPFCLTLRWKGTESGQPRRLWDSAPHPQWIAIAPWGTPSATSWDPLMQSSPRAKAQLWSIASVTPRKKTP